MTARAQSGPGNSAFIAGTLNYVAVPHIPSFNSLPITIMAWVNTTVTTGQQGLINKYVANSLNGWNVFLLNGRVRAWYFRSSANNVWGGGDGLDGGFIADGRWHHVAVVVDSSGGRIYVDGVERQARLWTGAFGSSTTTQELRIGSYPSGNNGFVGSIFLDDVSVWTTNLSFTRIQISMNGGVTEAEGSRLAYYLCNESSGTTVADSASLGGFNNGTWVGPALFLAVTPNAQTLTASPVSFSQATLNGVASPNRSTVSAGFQWGTTTNFGNTSVATTFGGASATSDQNYSLIATGLTSGTTYYFRAFASNSASMAFGAQQTFRTLGLLAETLPASGLTPTSAILNALVNAGGTNARAWFEHGFSTNYVFATPPRDIGSGTGDTNFSEPLSGLVPDVAYHFRAVASNSLGVAFGADSIFPSFAPREYVKASNTGANDSFGKTVAMDGDTLVIGAPSEASNATGVNGNQSNNSLSSGAVYVFVRSGDSLVQQAYLKASNTGIGDNFGGNVAVSGDTIVVGAPGEDSNATGINGDQSDNSAGESGAAYVFVRSGTNWTQQAYLKASNTEAFDSFGTSVAISGDTIVVGARGEDSISSGVNGNQDDNSGTNTGAAYVFVRNGFSWTQEAYLKASNARTQGEPVCTSCGAAFGGAVSASGNTVVVGAIGDSSNPTGINGNQTNTSALRSGAAYVFVRNGSTWTQQAYIKASNTKTFDEFGQSLAIAGDTLVVGAPGEDSNATGSGAAYVFARNGTTWTQQAYLKASNTGSDDFFGISVTVSGDRIVIGATGEDSNATGVNGDGANNLLPTAGAAYVFDREGATWSFREYLKASNTESNDAFGTSVAVSGNLVVVGADKEDSNAIGLNGDQSNNSASFSGAAYIFGPPLPPLPEINVSQLGTNIVSGGAGQAYFVAGANTQSRNFTIKNTGNGFLIGLTITFDGPDAAKFSVTFNPVAPLSPTSNTTFTVRFAPTSPGTNIATLHIASNDEDENPFDIQLSGVSLSFTEDRDGDGLNDGSEFLMASLGFNFQVHQASLVNTLFSNANGAGLFTRSQLQALNVNSPLLARDPLTGLFTLTIGVEKATQLTNFFPFPMTGPQTTINAEGKLEFQFSSPEGAAFFGLEAR